jgi:hypothetical protein
MTEDMTKEITEESRPEIVPSQSDLFRSIGERLSIAVAEEDRKKERKGGKRERGGKGAKGKEKRNERNRRKCPLLSLPVHVFRAEDEHTG